MNSFDKFKGIGVSPGRAIGKIKTILHHEVEIIIEPTIITIDNLDHNIIMLLIPGVVGVVAKQGSMGSHGAGILRELGIPCVIGNFYPNIQDGDLLEIYGENGYLIKIINKLEFDTCFVKDIANKIRIIDIDTYRSERKYQMLRYSILKLGWEQSFNFLFGMTGCHLELIDNIIYIHDGPNLDDLKEWIIDNPDWFFYNCKKREFEIESIKLKLKELETNIPTELGCLSIGDNINTFVSLTELYTKLLKYIYLTQFISEKLIQELAQIINEFGIRKISIANLLSSNYVSTSVKVRLHPGISTTWSLPSDKPVIFVGNLNWGKSRIIDNEIMDDLLLNHNFYGSSYIVKFVSLYMIVPMIYQMSEEHYFVSSSICSFLNYYIDYFSQIIYGSQSSFEVRNEIYNFTLDELIQFIKLKSSQNEKY